MHTEFEVKYYIDTTLFINFISDLGAKKIKENTLMKRYNFTHPSFERCSLRVRDEGDKVTMTYKTFGQKQTIDSVKEAEIIVGNFEQACLFLESLGYKKFRYVENYRQVWVLKDCFLMIDLWPGLDPIVEIEGPSRQAVEQVVALCGFDVSKGMFGAIVHLYKQKYGISLEKFDQIVRLDFDTDFKDFKKSLRLLK